MINGLISCLCSSYGRYTDLTRAVNCFINQNYQNKELIILNNHPAPLSTDLPQVKIYNEPKYTTLGDCRSRLLDLANGEFVKCWDDDDLYLAWHLSQTAENIKEAVAWKPEKSWFWHKDKPLELGGNAYEASILFRKDFVDKIGYKKSGGDEHAYLLDELGKKRLLRTDDVGILASYIYRWGFGNWHISGSLGGDKTIDERTKTWMDKNQDLGDGVIKKIDLKPLWNEFNKLRNQWQNRIVAGNEN